MSRFNQARSSYMSRNSSISNSNRMDTDSMNGGNDLEPETDGSREAQAEDEFQGSGGFNRNSSFRKSSLRRHSKRSNQSKPLAPVAPLPGGEDGGGGIHIAPLPPFLNGAANNPFYDNEDENPPDAATDLNGLSAQQQRSYQVLSSIILEESPQPTTTEKTKTPKSSRSKKEGTISPDFYLTFTFYE